MERHRIRLNTENSQRDVNTDLYQKINLSSDSKPLPFNDIKRVINENEQFNKERNESKKYRIIGTINPLFTNVLFNTTEDGSWAMLNEPIFRDRSFPPDGVSINQDEDYTFEESVEAHLKEKNGWFGYMNPRITGFADNNFYYMEPSKSKFEMVTKDTPNWDITLTYPERKLSDTTTENGLRITSFKTVTVGGKQMTAIGSPYKHNLELRDDVRIITPNTSEVYQVMRLGLDNGDYKENYFVIDFDIILLDTEDIYFKKVYSGVDCEYYYRIFKRVQTVEGGLFSNKDYDIFPLAFSKNVFDDAVYQFATKDDIDLTGLTDNLGRPVTELFVSFIKRNNKGFSDIKSGLLIENIYGNGNFIEIPDIRKIHNGGGIPFQSHTPLNDNVLFSDDEFVGDLVEYNKMLLRETVLNEVHHRFNTINRESDGVIPGIEVTPKSEVVVEEDTDTGGGIIDNPFEEFDFNPWGNGDLDSYLYLFKYQQFTKVGVCTNEELKLVYTNERGLGAATDLKIMDGLGKINQPAPAGYYSDGEFIKYWNGSSFTSFERCDGGDIQAEDTEEQIPEGFENNGNGTITEDDLAISGRQEGYYYKPFHSVKLREFSDYIETGDNFTGGIPDYAEKLEDDRYIWRDLMDIGNVSKNLDYPFLNGYHYIHNNYILALKRQDPFGEYNLRYDGDIPDIKGIKMNDKLKVNKSGDIC